MVGHRGEEQRAGIAGFLYREGHQVHASADGLRLLEWLGDALLGPGPPRPPDLIIMEIDLPGRRGIDLLADLRSVGWSTPFILLAGPEQTDLVEQVRRFSSAIVFVAPFELADLYTAVMVMLEHGPSSAAPLPARTERRGTPRAAVQLWAEEVTERALYLLRLENLSVTGAGVRHSLPRRVGERFHLRLTLPAQSAQIDAASHVVCVRRQGREYGVGVQFNDLRAIDEARIAAFVERRLMAVPAADRPALRP